MIQLDLDRSLEAGYLSGSQSRSWATSQDHQPEIAVDRPHTANCWGPGAILPIQYPCGPRRTVWRALAPIGSEVGVGDHPYSPSFHNPVMSRQRIERDNPSISASTCSRPRRADIIRSHAKNAVIMSTHRISAIATCSFSRVCRQTWGKDNAFESQPEHAAPVSNCRRTVRRVCVS
jgi:hypothetical protein